MSYEEEDTCHMRRRIHAFHPPSAPSLLQGSSIRAGKTIRDMSRQNIADRRTQTLRRSRMYARKRECVQSRSSPSPCACCAPIIVGEKASLIRLCGLACPKQRITCARKLGRPPRARPLFKAALREHARCLRAAGRTDLARGHTKGGLHGFKPVQVGRRWRADLFVPWVRDVQGWFVSATVCSGTKLTK
jgi:hypothetical protein